jgi:phosphohistidine phosphatase
MSRLYVLRHGKSDWGTGEPDHERPLNERGVRSSVAVGEFLAKAGEQPDLILSSTAVRALTTAGLVREAAGWEVPLETTRDLYDATVEGTLAAMSAIDANVERLMIVGHQPTWSEVISFLTGGRVAMKTAAVAALDTDAGWQTLRQHCCMIEFVLQPRLFTE